ncbi:MAG: TonB-dependent receptor, partial [Bacteroidota bacterium]
MRTSLYLLLLLTPISSLFAQHEFTGDIAGYVRDARSQEPLFGVNVVVLERPATGAATDTAGAFRILRVPVGTYSLRFTAVGYGTQVVTNVVVTTGRATPLLIHMDESAVAMGEVTVRATYFGRGQQLSPVSANQVVRSEILRLPGSAQDVQRVVQNLPGVASSTDNINELIVRGGAPFENLTIMDAMEIPSINHYSNQVNSAGPINMVNADMIEDVQFLSGGFPARYGDKASSVMNITVRQGDRNVSFASKSGFSMAGIGGLVEGRIGDRGSYIVSARNSLLEFVDKLVGLGTISLTAVPRYWDAQAKVVYDLSSTQSLIFNGLYGDSRITFDGTPDEQDALRAGRIDTSGVERLDPVTKQYAVGLSLRSLHGKSGFSTVTLYANGTASDVEVFNDTYRRVYDAAGNVTAYDRLTTQRFYSNRANEQFAAIKAEWFTQIHPRHELSVGASAGTSTHWSNDVFVAADTLRYDLDRNGQFETGPMLRYGGLYQDTLSFGDASKLYAYASDQIRIADELQMTVGLRFDRFTYSGRSTLSPRFSLAWQVLPPTTVVTLAAGEYTQSQPLPFYGDIRNTGTNRNLEHLRARHLVLGVEHIAGDGLKMSLETYLKTYRNVAVEEDFVYSAIDTFSSDRFLTTGERRAYGLELFLQQKQVEDWYGTLSLSWSRTQDRDPRKPPRTTWYDSDFDYPVVLSMMAGKVVKGVRDWLDEAP